MREIKFRGWSESDNKMYHDKAHHSMSIQESGESISLSFAGDVSFEFFSNGACFMVTKNEEGYKNTDNSIIPMQYTGLKDINGTEIYEGDVSFDEWNDCYGVVKFDEAKFVYEWEDVCEDLIEVHDYLNVVGNIYENPELLEDD